MTFSFFILLWGFAAYPGNRQMEVQKIDAEIQELEDMKRGYESRALRHENQAEYLQFEQQAVLETRRHIQLAEENRYKAELVQKQIDRLKARRSEISN
jgi:hypothetical protein